MSNDIALIGGQQLPAHLQGVNTGVSAKLLQGMFDGGNRIGLRGSRFRLIVNGIEEGVIGENYLDVIFLSAAPAISRIFYEGAYKQGENQPPTCYSADGVTPADDVKAKQSSKCMTCPQNIKGSKIDGGQKYKACGFFRRLVVMLAGDVEDRRTFKLDVKSQGLFADDTANAKALNNYIKSLESRGVDAGQVVTRVSFDSDSSVPKLLFRPQRYIGQEEYEAVTSLVGSDEVEKLAEVTMATVDLSGEDTASAEEEKEEQESTATQTVKPQTVKPQTVKPQVDTVPAQSVQQTVKPTQQAAKPAVVEDDAGLDELLAGLDV